MLEKAVAETKAPTSFNISHFVVKKLLDLNKIVLTANFSTV